MNNREKGSRYEQIAAAYLEKEGMTIVEKNFRCKIGEIDLIARDKDILCFVEVKYRTSISAGFPFEAVNYSKQRKIRNVAAFYLKRYGISFDTPCRFDVISILGENISLYKNAYGSF